MGQRIARSANSLPVLSAIDIQKDADIIHRQLMDGFRMSAKDCPASDVSGEIHQFRKNRAVEENRVAAKTPVKGNQYLRARLTPITNHLLERGGTNKRLIREHDQGTFDLQANRGEALAQRRPHTLLKIRIKDDAQSIGYQLFPNLISRCAQNQDDLVHI